MGGAYEQHFTVFLHVNSYSWTELVDDCWTVKNIVLLLRALIVISRNSLN